LRFIDKTRLDLAKIVSADLQKPVSLLDVDGKLIDWIELKNRRLPDEVWKVEKSSEILTNPFSVQYAAGLQVIENNFVNGKSNRAHQSKTTDVTEYNDLLFNDWGIHHFHLSDQYEGAFCKRTGPVLFIYFQGQTAYFIDILEHGRASPHVWADEHLIALIDKNWPQISDSYILKGALDLATGHTPEERMKLRRAGITSLLKVNGKIFMPFGLGLNTAKGSTQFSMQAMKILRALNQSIKEISENGDFKYPDESRLSQAVPKNVRLGAASAILRLRFQDGRFELFEEKSNQIVLYSAKIVG
jgi:hypothetical protein